VYAAQLLGESFSVGARYRVSDVRYDTRFPGLAPDTHGVGHLAQSGNSLLHQLALSLNFNHGSGAFAQWESLWLRQENDAAARNGEDFWQHNVFVGYRFPRRHTELRFGVLNLTDTDYRLNPLNFHSALPRGRTFVASIRMNF
jgi:outer membrane receptor protein involved in Fe transport